MNSTQRWLHENTLFYSNSSRVYADVDAALLRYSNIRPKTDVYTYDDGRTQLLLCLHGLLSISYRQASYNIPVAIWLTRDYPREPPIAYVVATSDILVRSSQFVEISGRCNIEYIQNWHRKSEGCNILALLESMQSHFSKEPPVYAKPKDPPPSQNPLTHNDYSAKPPPPLPQNLPRSPPLQNESPPPALPQSQPLQPAYLQIKRPLLPPKPVSGFHILPNTHPINYAHKPSHVALSPSASTSPPLLPDQYQQHFTPRPSSVGSVYTSASGFAPHPPPPPISHDPSPPVQTQRWSMAPMEPIASHMYPQPPISPPQPPLHAYQPPQPLVPITLPQPTPPRNILDEDTPEGGESAFPPAPALAPPRPPNPELLHLHAQIHAKLVSELGSLSQAMSLDAERLRAHQSDLLAGEPAIRDEMARLEAVRDVCNSVARRLRVVVDQGERNVADLKQKGDPEVDELVCSTTIVHNQLINLIAEDNAIEDTIYHLHRALNAGRIDLERFIRTTRILAEEQFMKRALIEKIQVRISWS